MKRNIRADKREEKRKQNKRMTCTCDYCKSQKLFRRFKEDVQSLEEIGKRALHPKNIFRRGMGIHFFWHKPEKKEQFLPEFVRKEIHQQLVEEREREVLHSMKNLQVLAEFGLRTLEAEHWVFTKCRDFQLAFSRAIDWFYRNGPEHEDFFQRFKETAHKVAEFEQYWENRWKR